MSVSLPLEEASARSVRAKDASFLAPLFDLDAFVSWLCEHEIDVVGQSGTWFHSPLAEWLFSLTGHVYGVEAQAYGRACMSPTCWASLPLWAQRFSARLEARAFRPVTGAEALLVLAEVERTLAAITPVWKSL
jgi:hypothetical protein